MKTPEQIPEQDALSQEGVGTKIEWAREIVGGIILAGLLSACGPKAPISFHDESKLMPNPKESTPQSQPGDLFSGNEEINERARKKELDSDGNLILDEKNGWVKPTTQGK